MGSVLLIFFFMLSYYVSLHSRRLVPCCDVHIKTMFGSSLSPIVCNRVHVIFILFVFVCSRVHVIFTLFVFVCSRVHVIFTLFVFVSVQWCPSHIALWFCLSFVLYLVYQMLLVSLESSIRACPFL